jgi:hypothetical protein
MIRTLFLVGLLGALCGACSSSDAPAGTEGGAGSPGNGSCPALSGAWDITQHCESSFIGMTLQITQKDCALSCAPPFDQFVGNVTADGKITMSGPQSCTGTATENAVSMNCTPDPCPVKLVRVAR